LIKAINTFNAGKGARLATYAARCIDNEILMYFRNQKKTAQDVSMSEVTLFLGTMAQKSPINKAFSTAKNGRGHVFIGNLLKSGKMSKWQ